MLQCKNGAWEIAEKPGSTRQPNNARPGYWRVRTATPFGTFTPSSAFCMVIWQNLHGRPMPERGLSGVHGPFPYSGITGRSPLGVRTAVNRRFSSWMRAGIDPVVAGPCRWKCARFVLPRPIRPGHAVHIRTTMGFDSKRVVDPDHVCILFVFQLLPPASCLVELVELSPRRVPPHDSIPSSLDGICNNRPIAI